MEEEKQEIVNEKVETQPEEVELVEVDLTDEMLEEKKIQLLSMTLQKDDSDLQLGELTAQLDGQIPKKLLQDAIDRIESDIKEKRFRTTNQQGSEKLEDATEAEIELMKIKLMTMNKQKELDMPMRDLRYRVYVLNKQKEMSDSPEKQVPKLLREIKTKKSFMPKKRAEREMGYVG
jgi:hypothetical protein